MRKELSPAQAMTIQFTLPTREERRVRTTVCVPDQPPRPHCLSHALALAHRLEGRVRSGEMKDYVAIAKISGVSRARIGQNGNLLMLAPPIQECVLGLRSSEKRVTERVLRTVIKEWNWDRQRAIFYHLTGRPTGAEPVETVPNLT